jgi:hypothetical protein
MALTHYPGADDDPPTAPAAPEPPPDQDAEVSKTEVKKARQTTAGPKRGNPNVDATKA